MTERGEDLLISLRNVGLSYPTAGRLLRRRKALAWGLRDVSLDLYRGESLGVIGRNGMGKSTLLRLLAGIIKPDRGEMIKNGCSASMLSLQVGFVPYLSGRENAILSGLLLGMPRADVERRLPDIIRFAELEGAIDKPIYTYSDGMRARLGFAVAFQIDPDILLIDEVLGAGDAGFREKSAAAMKEKIRSDKTVVLVSHNASVIRQLCNRAVWIEEGVSKAEGPTEEVLKLYEAHIRDLQKRRQGQQPTPAAVAAQ